MNFSPVALGATCLFATLLYPIATRWPRWSYKGPALVAQADRHKDPMSEPGESVRGPMPFTDEAPVKAVEVVNGDADKPAAV